MSFDCPTSGMQQIISLDTNLTIGLAFMNQNAFNVSSDSKCVFKSPPPLNFTDAPQSDHSIFTMPMWLCLLLITSVWVLTSIMACYCFMFWSRRAQQKSYYLVNSRQLKAWQQQLRNNNNNSPAKTNPCVDDFRWESVNEMPPNSFKPTTASNGKPSNEPGPLPAKKNGGGA